MSTEAAQEPGRADPAIWHVPAQMMADYAAGRGADLDSWSVETHLAQCAQCRGAVSVTVSNARMARNRAVVVGLIAVPAQGRVARGLSRCGVSEHILRLLAATPSLRRSWLLSIFSVLVLVTAEMALARWWLPGHSGAPGAAALPVDGRAAEVMLLLVGPLLVLATVAVSYLAIFDPSYRLMQAAPVSGFTVLMVRVVSAVTVSLGPVVCVALVAPGPAWLPAAVLLPSLALCATALAAGRVVGQTEAAVGVGVAWVAAVLAVTVLRSPLAVVDWPAQIVCAGALAGAAWLVVHRDRLEAGWSR